MSTAVFAALLAALGAGVGLAMRPLVAKHEAPLPSWPVAELVTAGLFALIAWRVGINWRVAPFMVFAASLVALSIVDLRRYLLPNAIMYPANAICAVMIVAGELIDGSTGAIVRAAVGSAVYFLVLFIFHIVYPAGLGYGDVKLARLLGMFLGWVSASIAETLVGVLWAMFFGSLIGTVVGVLLLGIRKAGKDVMPDPLGGKRAQSNFPFGPPLAVAGLALSLWPSVFAI